MQQILRLARSKAFLQFAFGQLQGELSCVLPEMMNAFLAERFDFGSDIVMDVFDLHLRVMPKALRAPAPVRATPARAFF